MWRQISRCPVQKELFKPFSTVVGVVAFLLAAFDLFLWRLSWLQGWFVKRPHLWPHMAREV